jgi:RHS repeat-associated protein
LTNSSGEATASFTYSPYGGLEGTTGSAATPLGFAGQYTDSDTGMQYLRARWYDPQTGQFLTRDPLEGITRRPYAYGEDNPLANVDRTGLSGEELEVPCFWPCGPPPAPAVETVEQAFAEAEDAISGAYSSISSIFGGDDSTDQGPTLTKEQEEYEEEHHECELEDPYAGTNAEAGDAAEALLKAEQFVEKLGQVLGSDPNQPSGGSRWIRILALMARLLDALQHK